MWSSPCECVLCGCAAWWKLIVSPLAVSVYISTLLFLLVLRVNTRAVYIDISVNYRNTMVLSRAGLLYRSQNRIVPRRAAFIRRNPTTNNTLDPEDVSLLSFDDTGGYCPRFVSIWVSVFCLPLCHHLRYTDFFFRTTSETEFDPARLPSTSNVLPPAL